MRKPRYELARRRVWEVLDACSHEETAPIDIHRVLEHLNVRYVERPMRPTTSGMLVVTKGQAAIAVNSNHHVHRRRFSAAHEVGHLVMEHVGPSGTMVDVRAGHTPRPEPVSGFKMRNERSSRGVDPDEIEANAFASELLMPAKLVLAIADKLCTEGVEGDDLTEEMAGKFVVSTAAMSITLDRHGFINPLYW